MSAFRVALGAAGLLTCSAASGADLGCSANPSLSGACSHIHGTVGLAPGTGFVLGPTGAAPDTVIGPAPHSTQAMPPLMWRYLVADPVAITVTGDFLTCPVPARPGEYGPRYSHTVCIDSAAHVIVRTTRSVFGSQRQ